MEGTNARIIRKAQGIVKNSPGDCKIVQDCRSSMLRARLDTNLTSIGFDTIIQLFDNGMLSRLKLNIDCRTEYLDKFGYKLSLVLHNMLSFGKPITLCINSTRPKFIFDERTHKDQQNTELPSL